MKKGKNNLFAYFMGIAIMNGLDGVLTFIGLQKQLVEESNPLMDYLYNLNPLLFLLVKLLFTALVILFAFTIKPSTNIKGWKIFLGLTNILYVGIILLHAFWVGLYFFYN